MAVEIGAEGDEQPHLNLICRMRWHLKMIACAKTIQSPRRRITGQECKKDARSWYAGANLLL